MNNKIDIQYLKQDINEGLTTNSVIIHKQFDKIANKMLSDISINDTLFIEDLSRKSTRNCRIDVQWDDEEFWKTLSNIKSKPIVNEKIVVMQTSDILIPCNNKKIVSKIVSVQEKSQHSINHHNKPMIKKFFHQWCTYVKNRKKKREFRLKQIQNKAKMEEFMQSLKRCKRMKQMNNSKLKKSITVPVPKTNTTAEPEVEQNAKVPNPTNLESECFKNRFKAQQDIIQIQKEKLAKQEKIIEDLKLGKLEKEIEESIHKTTVEIKETLSNCSNRVKCKIQPVMVDHDPLKFHLALNKAPKIVREMERRAIERVHKRQIILDRKRIIDEEKKRMAELEIQRNQAQDKEDRKRKLEEIKERQRKEIELHYEKQLKLKAYTNTLNMVNSYYDRKCLQFGFVGFKKLIEIKERTLLESEIFYENKLLKRIIHNWSNIIKQLNKVKYFEVDNFYNRKLLKNVFCIWYNYHLLQIQSLQVAEDIYEFRLQSKTFIHWHRYTCKQYVINDKNMKKAKHHYDRRLMWHSFYQWKSLPAVLKLEKAKEEKKQKWREKVWEILPDYEPYIED